jgi:putative acetyltransferase
MAEELSLKKAAQDHAPAIHRLISDVLGYSNLYHLRPPFVDSDIDNLEYHYFGSNGFFWIAQDHDDEIIASVAIFKLRDQTCELRKMYLKVTEQGKGFGKQLLQTAMAGARELGYAEMVLKTNSKLSKAIELYKKYGFEFVPIEEEDKKADCDVAMLIKL